MSLVLPIRGFESITVVRVPLLGLWYHMIPHAMLMYIWSVLASRPARHEGVDDTARALPIWYDQYVSRGLVKESA